MFRWSLPGVKTYPNTIYCVKYFTWQRVKCSASCNVFAVTDPRRGSYYALHLIQVLNQCGRVAAWIIQGIYRKSFKRPIPARQDRKKILHYINYSTWHCATIVYTIIVSNSWCVSAAGCRRAQFCSLFRFVFLGFISGLYIGLVELLIPILGEASPHERHVFKIFVIFFAIIDCSL